MDNPNRPAVDLVTKVLRAHKPRRLTNGTLVCDNRDCNYAIWKDSHVAAAVVEALTPAEAS